MLRGPQWLEFGRQPHNGDLNPTRRGRRALHRHDTYIVGVLEPWKKYVDLFLPVWLTSRADLTKLRHATRGECLPRSSQTPNPDS